MNFDTTIIAGGIPLGAFVSLVLSFLKGQFGLSSEQARNVVAFCGLGYAVAVGIAKGLANSVDVVSLVVNALSSGIALVFGSEGFYQWISKIEMNKEGS